MTVRNQQPRTRLEAAFIKYGLKVAEVARLAGTNRMRINRLMRGVAPARPPIRARLLKVIRHLANDESITEADLFPVEG
jgi:transcriptional regulator with XRE-family HTH domain